MSIHEESQHEGSSLVSKGPCPECGHEKTLATYSDGHVFCYYAGCGYKTRATTAGPRLVVDRPASDKPSALLAPDWSSPFNRQGLTKRQLSTETLRRLGIFVATYNKTEVQCYPYYSRETGDEVAQKLRFPDKSFPVLKAPEFSSIPACLLFGQQYFGDRFDRQVIVTEGELDAASVCQALEWKTAVVSIGAGTKGAAEHLKANYLWLDRFADIVLWFDNDTTGKEAMQECAKLFKVGKVRLAKATGFKDDGVTPCKDASDMLQAARPGDIKQAIYTAAKWRPRGIVNARDNIEDVLAPKEDDSAFRYNWPWDEITATLGPILPGQVCYHVAGTGIGKSTAVATIAFNVIEQGGKVGYLSFEGTRREIKLSLITVHSGKRVDIEPLPDAVMEKLHEAAFGSGNMELFDPEQAEWTMEALEGYIRYLNKALDCTLIVIDPLSAIVALSGEQDERRALDKISMTFSVMAKELGVHLQISHHLTRPHGIPHEEGAATALNEVRGSGGLANFATFVIGHERNQQAEGDDWKLTQLRSLKNRPRSKTGPIMVLEYSLETGQLTRTTRKFPPPGKPADGDHEGGSSSKRSNGGFAAVGDDY